MTDASHVDAMATEHGYLDSESKSSPARATAADIEVANHNIESDPLMAAP